MENPLPFRVDFAQSTTEWYFVLGAFIRMMDAIDAEILDKLQQNARETQVEIARAVGLAPSAVMERIRKLEARRIIRGYTAELDPHALDQQMLAFVAVRSVEGPAEDDVAQQLAALPQVLEVHHVAGDDCYLLKVRARDAEHLGQLLRQQIAATPTVVSTRTTIVLETVKEDPRIAIPRALTTSGGGA
jgi:Lrp/AsnC family leucine-responsive transcriptional regulator